MIKRADCRCICHQGYNEPAASHIVPCCEDAWPPRCERIDQTNVIIDAAVFAKNAHAGQLRKYTHRPYIEHPARIASTLMMKNASPALIAGAWLHDVVEDCGISVVDINTKFGADVGFFVWVMTNPSKKHPKLSRADKKKMDREHWSRIQSGEAQWLKAEDRLDNLRDAWSAPEDWRKMYAKESIHLIDVLTKAPEEVRLDAYNVAEQLLGLSI